MTRRLFLLFAATAMLAGCSNPEKTARYLIPPEAAVAERLPNRLGRIELREVTLPEYAAGQEVPYQAADGALRSRPDQVWADTPALAITQALARQLSDLTGAVAVPEPWPLNDGPDRRLEVRVEEMIAGNDGQFRFSGQYFIVAVDSGAGDIARRFDLVVPIAGEGYPAIVAANTAAVRQLARQIAAGR